MNNDIEFYEERRRQLIYFLNYCLTHNEINKSNALNKFLNDTDFDETYFQREINIYDYPESHKCEEGVTNRLYGVFTKIFKNNQNLDPESLKCEKLKNIENFYGIYLKELKNLKGHIVKFL
jgi:hypothetical protein